MTHDMSFLGAGTDAKFVFQGVGMLFDGSFVDTVWEKDEVRKTPPFPSISF
jgi:hypothetical protein